MTKLARVLVAGRYAYDISGTVPEVLMLHPRTGKIVRECDVRWPDDYGPHEVARNLRAWYGKDARARAVELGAWEAAMLLEERSYGDA
jgi:hypothetical protein